MMELGVKVRQLRLAMGMSQGDLAASAGLSQGYLSQIENSEVKNPSAAVLLRLAEAINVDPDELFEAAGYPSVRTMRNSYQSFEARVDPGLLQYMGRLSRQRQRRLLLFLKGMEGLVEEPASDQQASEDDSQLPRRRGIG